MIEIEYDNLNYHRSLVQELNSNIAKALKTNYDYSFVISYGKFNDDEYDVVDKYAAIIELNADLESVFAKFNATTRKHLRRFKKMSELKIHREVLDFEAFYNFYSQCEFDRDWFPVPKNELKNSIVFYVTYNGKPISGMSAYKDNGFIRLGRIFSLVRSSDFEKKNLVFGIAAKKIVFEFCKYASENGYTQLDLGGVDLSSENKSGITFFKMNFSPRIIPVKIGRYSSCGEIKELQARLMSQKLDLT